MKAVVLVQIGMKFFTQNIILQPIKLRTSVTQTFTLTPLQ